MPKRRNGGRSSRGRPASSQPSLAFLDAGQWVRTKRGSSQCKGFSNPPHEEVGRLIRTYPQGAAIGPIKAVIRSQQYLTILVSDAELGRNVYINVAKSGREFASKMERSEVDVEVLRYALIRHHAWMWAVMPFLTPQTRAAGEFHADCHAQYAELL